MKYKRVYLAGPMRGYPQWNHPAFFAAADKLRQLGCEIVWNPAEHDKHIGFDNNKSELSVEDFQRMMRWDFERVMEAEAVVFLHGWTRSRGACAERLIAYYLGIPCLDYIDYGNGDISLIRQDDINEPTVQFPDPLPF